MYKRAQTGDVTSMPEYMRHFLYPNEYLIEKEALTNTGYGRIPFDQKFRF